MGLIVCKFGGSSVATADRIRQVAGIIQQDARRWCIVVSAPGKRHAEDHKITDLLYLCYHAASQGVTFDASFSLIRERYLQIARGLRVSLDVEALLDEVYEQICSGAPCGFVASRGEYLCARIVADFLDATFLDAAECIRFQRSGELDDTTYDLLPSFVLDSGRHVIPGFYGATAEGEVQTFSRGGSDITGSIVARALNATVYENWTDVPGLLMADPRVVDLPKPMRMVTYRELRELTYMGADVFHPEAIIPVAQTKIPIHIRSTMDPEDPGTQITHTRDFSENVVVGIAGKPGFSMISIEVFLMNQVTGFGRRVLGILEDHDISYEHSPTGIDSMSIIISDEELGDRGEAVIAEIERMLCPDRVDLQPGLALIATVGEGMAYQPGIAARLFTALGQAGVNVRIIDQGSSEINIIVGVASADYQRAVRAIYEAFC